MDPRLFQNVQTVCYFVDTVCFNVEYSHFLRFTSPLSRGLYYIVVYTAVPVHAIGLL